uniref:Uncharacterized protein n=1 Tax=Panagrolaimus sp. ES5 TaxID=591445 RepID=A0AC34G278_9BILA
MPFVSYVALEKWIFQRFANHIYAKADDIIFPDDVNCGDIIYVKTDFIENFIKTYHKQIKNPYILITQQSDYKIGYPWQLDVLNDPKIIKWFAVNVIAKHPKLEPIPVGNGIDPHRTWEALSMGEIPIVLNQSEFQSLFDDMPVMVQRWSTMEEKVMAKILDNKNHERKI